MGGDDADVAYIATQIHTQLRIWVRVAGVPLLTWHHVADVAA